MTSKEALNCIIYRLTAQEDDLELRETAKVEIAIIKKDLKRLEKLTKTPTEEEVLKEFEEKGWELITSNNEFFVFTKPHPLTKDSVIRITINKIIKQYVVTLYNQSNKQTLHSQTTIEIHQLLTKLFKAWNWV